MLGVVLSSSSLYSTFISTVDHLPCDIVRSLWLVQTCNLALEREKQNLHYMLQKHTAKHGSEGQNSGESILAHDFYLKQKQITRWHDEAVAELDSLCNQLEVHEKLVKDQVLQLQAAAEVPLAKDPGSLDLLRQQLRDHYKKNPLPSQVEALNEHERVLQDQGRVVIKKTPGNGAGIKIIFKLSRSPQPGAEIQRSRRLRDGLLKSTNEEISAPNKVMVPLGVKTERRTRASLPDKVVLSAEVLLPRRRGRPPKILPVGSADSAVLAQNAPVSREKRSLKQAAPPKKVVKPAGRPKAKVQKKIVQPVYESPPVEEEDTELYCFCKQKSFGDMIACDNEKCTNGEWFHYKCVGLLNRVEALRYTTEKWYCSEFCRAAVAQKPPKPQKKKGKRRRY